MTRAPEVGASSADALFTVRGCATTVQRWTAGVESTLPAASTARTSNLWERLDSLVYFFGEVHRANVPAPSLHWNVAASLAENVNVAESVAVRTRGRRASLVSGAIASIVHSWDASGPVFCAPSSARTANVCGPCPSV